MPGKKILIIDDETDLCLLLKDYFVRKHYAVTIAHNLKDGMEILYKMNPDILFLDNNLPDGTGWNLAKDFAGDMPDMNIVLISGFHPSDPEMPAGAKYRVIEKPIRMADLDRQFAAL